MYSYSLLQEANNRAILSPPLAHVIASPPIDIYPLRLAVRLQEVLVLCSRMPIGIIYQYNAVVLPWKELLLSSAHNTYVTYVYTLRHTHTHSGIYVLLYIIYIYIYIYVIKLSTQIYRLNKYNNILVKYYVFLIIKCCIYICTLLL